MVSPLDIGWRLLVVLPLVAAKDFFVAAEFSLVSARNTRIDGLITQVNRRARVI